MKISELFEQTIAPVPPGQPTQQGTTTPVTTATNTLGNQQVTPPQPNNQIGQPPASSANPQQIQQMQQTAKTTMTDLDKIAAQLVGLKQKQQQMQQQMQQVKI